MGSIASRAFVSFQTKTDIPTGSDGRKVPGADVPLLIDRLLAFKHLQSISHAQKYANDLIGMGNLRLVRPLPFGSGPVKDIGETLRRVRHNATSV